MKKRTNRKYEECVNLKKYGQAAAEAEIKTNERSISFMILCGGFECDNKEKNMSNMCCNDCDNLNCEDRCNLDKKDCGQTILKDCPKTNIKPVVEGLDDVSLIDFSR